MGQNRVRIHVSLSVPKGIQQAVLKEVRRVRHLLNKHKKPAKKAKNNQTKDECHGSSHDEAPAHTDQNVFPAICNDEVQGQANSLFTDQEILRQENIYIVKNGFIEFPEATEDKQPSANRSQTAPAVPPSMDHFLNLFPPGAYAPSQQDPAELHPSTPSMRSPRSDVSKIDPALTEFAAHGTNELQGLDDPLSPVEHETSSECQSLSEPGSAQDSPEQVETPRTDYGQDAEPAPTSAPCASPAYIPVVKSSGQIWKKTASLQVTGATDADISPAYVSNHNAQAYMPWPAMFAQQAPPPVQITNIHHNYPVNIHTSNPQDSGTPNRHHNQGNGSRPQCDRSKRRNNVKWQKMQEAPQMVELTSSTVRLANIPNNMRRKQVLKEVLDRFGDRFDFLYLSFDWETKNNYGYAFINFLSPEDASDFQGIFEGRGFQSKPNSKKKAHIGNADAQGLQACLQKFGGAHPVQQGDRRFQPIQKVNGTWRLLNGDAQIEDA
jgi:hypothetical protein